MTSRREVVQSLGVGTLGLALPFGRTSAPTTGDGRQPLREIRVIENVFIPMPDGTRIAARIVLPVDAETNKVPAILEYIPYHKRDGTRDYDESRHPYWAEHGYAGVRVDIRGSGDSDGIQVDEYVKQEQDDGVEIIRWLGRQPWCTGSVGMVGISWGGFSALQVAARRPPELKAIITHCSTDDRFADDAHYMGGCLLQDNFIWGSDFFTIVQPSAPDPDIVGADRWKAMWMERLNALEPRLADWTRHQRRDAFWKHASVNQDFAAITCAVYAISGWVDPYHHVVPRLLAGLTSPRKGLVGPWSHNYPHEGLPGPSINYLDEAIRWWDHWLKGVDTGIMREPMYRVWMQKEAACCGAKATAGWWVAESNWPSSKIGSRRWYLTRRGIETTRAAEEPRVVPSCQSVGIAGGQWCPFDMDTELPRDQGIDDGRSLCFNSPSLTAPLEILGAPVVLLEVSVDRPVATVAVRLNDLAPDGGSRRVTFGVLNLTHRDGHDAPTPIVPGQRYRVRIELKDIAHSFQPGHRMRIAISTSYWPMVLPPPEAVRMTVFVGSSELLLPVRARRPEDGRQVTFGPPTDRQKRPRLLELVSSAGAATKQFELDAVGGKATLRSNQPARRVRFKDIQTIRENGDELMMEVTDSDPTNATLYDRRWTSWERGDWKPRIETELRLTLTPNAYLLKSSVIARNGEEIVFSKAWDHSIPRDLI